MLAGPAAVAREHRRRVKSYRRSYRVQWPSAGTVPRFHPGQKGVEDPFIGVLQESLEGKRRSVDGRHCSLRGGSGRWRLRGPQRIPSTSVSSLTKTGCVGPALEHQRQPVFLVIKSIRFETPLGGVVQDCAQRNRCRWRAETMAHATTGCLLGQKDRSPTKMALSWFAVQFDLARVVGDGHGFLGADPQQAQSWTEGESNCTASEQQSL